MKSYTNIEQSKKLAEILPLESADMRYEKCYVKLHPPFKSDDIIPCWSLAGLLSVLPQSVRLVGTPKDSYWYCECVDSNNQCYSGFGSSDNPIDACYEMLIKLHKLNLL